MSKFLFFSITILLITSTYHSNASHKGNPSMFNTNTSTSTKIPDINMPPLDINPDLFSTEPIDPNGVHRQEQTIRIDKPTTITSNSTYTCTSLEGKETITITGTKVFIDALDVSQFKGTIRLNIGSQCTLRTATPEKQFPFKVERKGGAQFIVQSTPDDDDN